MQKEKGAEIKFTVRFPAEVAGKLAYLSAYYGRSQNQQINWLVKLAIAEFEKENGPIALGEK